MRILVVCQRYWPEQFQVTAICEGLARRGHAVTVLCGLPNVGIPGAEQGVVPEEYHHGKNRQQEKNGVRIVRSFEIGRRSGVAWRTLNYYSFWKSASRKILDIEGEFDVVFAYQLSPAMMCAPARSLKRKRGTPYLLYCCDLWPESMKAMLGDRFPAVVNHFGKVCGRIYRDSDRLAVQSPDFFEYFREYHRVDDSKLVYIPQFSTDGARPGSVSHEGVNMLFMGNMGTVQGISLILEAFNRCTDVEGFFLHFVGDGVMLGPAKDYVSANGLGDRVVFHGRHPVAEMSRYYAIADICVLALDSSTLIGSTIPSKLQGYMAAGKPIVAALGGGAKTVIDEARCGLVVAPGDVESFAQAMRRLAFDGALREKFGRNARSYFERNFTEEAFLDAVERELSAIAKKGTHDR